MKKPFRCLALVAAVLLGLTVAPAVFAQDSATALIVAPACGLTLNVSPSGVERAQPIIVQQSGPLCATGCSGQPFDLQCTCPPTSPNPTGYAECDTWRADCWFL
jgi:hypothetical protein